MPVAGCLVWQRSIKILSNCCYKYCRYKDCRYKYRHYKYRHYMSCRSDSELTFCKKNSPRPVNFFKTMNSE